MVKIFSFFLVLVVIKNLFKSLWLKSNMIWTYPLSEKETSVIHQWCSSRLLLAVTEFAKSIMTRLGFQKRPCCAVFGIFHGFGPAQGGPSRVFDSTAYFFKRSSSTFLVMHTPKEGLCLGPGMPRSEIVRWFFKKSCMHIHLLPSGCRDKSPERVMPCVEPLQTAAPPQASTCTEALYKKISIP